MKNKETNETKIIVLGGLGEVGKNMYCVMHKDAIVIIDAGVSFPESELMGVDYVLPNFTFLKENEDKIKALLITHGHEDHIGGIPFLLQSINIPAIYAPNHAKELISVKLQDRNIRYDNLFVYTDQTKLKFKEIEVEFFRITHSIPDSHGISIKTPDGRLVFTGDYKFDLTPIGPMADLYKMTSLGEEGVDILLGDSTNALNEGFSNSESVVDETVEKAYRELLKETDQEKKKVMEITISALKEQSSKTMSISKSCKTTILSLIEEKSFFSLQIFKNSFDFSIIFLKVDELVLLI